MENLQAYADKSAIVVSVLCALHCLLFPAILILYPTMMELLPGDETVHFVLLFLVIPISSFALFKGGKVHKSRKIITIGFTGLLVLVLAVTFGHDIFGQTGEKILTVIGSIIVVTAHIQNHLICQRTDCRCHDDGLVYKGKD